MSDSKQSKPWRRRLLILMEAALFVTIIVSIYAWRTRDLLPTDQFMPAPGFELQDLDGRTWRIEDFKGKPTVLYFFAPWCTVCAASAHQLRWFHDWFGDEVNLVMIGLDYLHQQELTEYSRNHDIENPVLIGTADVGRDYKVPGYPTYYVLDADGRIRRKDFGASTVVGLWWRTRD
jgi:peroxiredoxin